MRAAAILLVSLTVASCQVKPYAPPPRLAEIESVEVVVGDFSGRPEATAIVKGRLSTSAAQLVDPRQSRVERSLVLEVLEQTPRGATLLPDLALSPEFETRIPVEILGLEPGPCLLFVNGIATSFEIPPIRAEQVEVVTHSRSAVTLVDEFIPIEDTIPLGTEVRVDSPSGGGGAN